MNFVQICKIASNSCGYVAFISSSISQVAYEKVWFVQISLTKGICLLCSCLILRYWTGCSSYTRPSVTAMGLVMIAWLGSKMYFLSCVVRKILCTCSSYIGRSSRQTTGFNLSINWYGPVDFRLNLARSSNLLIPLVGETFWKTLSSTWNSIGLLLLSA